MMDKLRLFFCVLTVALSSFLVAESAENQTCVIAKSFAQSSPQNQNIHLHCDADKSCAGFHCRGVYLQNNLQLNIKQGDWVCFGAIINHCDTPLSMDIYYQHENKHTYQKRLYHNTSMQIPGMSLHTAQMKFDLFLFVEMVHKDNEVTIALTAKLRVTMGKVVHWPDTSKYQVIPVKTFPVPPCPPGENRNTTPQPHFPSCVAPPLVPSTTIKPMSKTYGKHCDPTKVYQCGKNEMCTYKNICSCASGMVVNQFSGYCDHPGASPNYNMTSVAPTTIKNAITNSSDISGTPAPQTSMETTKKSSTGLITGLAVGAVAILGIVILVSFLVWRSRKARFDHMPLVENEDACI